MKSNRMKLIAILFFVLPVLAVTVFKVSPVTVAANSPEDPAVIYKAKCAMCHTAKAEKAFDPAKADADLVQIVLKGKKGEKPPNMPAFEGKVTEADAAALVTYMKSLRAPAN